MHGGIATDNGILFTKKNEEVRSAAPRICLLLQQRLDGTNPGSPLLQPPTTLQPFFQSQPPESATQLSAITGTSHHFF